MALFANREYSHWRRKHEMRTGEPIAVALDQREVIRSEQSNSLRRNDGGAVVGYASGFNLVEMVAQATFATGMA